MAESDVLDDPFGPRAMAAREQMRAALYWYARAIDRGQSGFLSNAFHPDATIDCGSFSGDLAGFGAMLDERRRAVPRAVHMIGNMLVDFLGSSRAFAETYCLALEEFLPETPGGPNLNRLVRVRYADEFACRDDAWKISHHLIIIDHVMPAEAAVPPDGFFSGASGRRDADDPILLRRATLGIG